MEQNLNEILKLRREKLANLQNAGKDPFVITKFDQTHHSVEIKENYDELEGKTVSVAGRMMFKRVMGKASFCNIQDLKGSIQAYVARDVIGVDMPPPAAPPDFSPARVGPGRAPTPSPSIWPDLSGSSSAPEDQCSLGNPKPLAFRGPPNFLPSRLT